MARIASSLLAFIGAVANAATVLGGRLTTLAAVVSHSVPQ